MAIVDVVKYDGGPDVFAWKYPNQELGTWTQLIVNESQEALLFKGGQALDLFTAGRHTLDTANIPILSKLIKLPFGGRSPFTAEVWFINKIYSLDIKWGTSTPIQLQDPKYKIFIPVRSFGQFGIKIMDSRKFIMKLVGTMPVFDKNTVLTYFRGLYLTKVKDSISAYLLKKQISILEINAYLDELSEYLKGKMESTFEEYGINLVNFFVNDINVPENDPAVMKLKDALAKRAEMEIVGYNYVQERSFDTLEGAATNKGNGQAGMMGAGMGLGMGVGLGGTFGQQMGGVAQNINLKDTKKCPKCGRDIDKTSRFCNYCGVDTQSVAKQSANETPSDKVKCSNCGYEYPKNVKFCPECGDPYNPCAYCGADLKDGATHCDACGKDQPKLCPKCGAKVPVGVKFCPECGASLIRKCPKCGAAVKENAKFCPECGEKLAGGEKND